MNTAMNSMPSQRPFFANFLAAFRAHSAIQQQQSKAPTSSSSPPQHTTSSSNPASTSTSSPNPGSSHPRSIAAKSSATTSALNQLHSPRSHSTSPLSRSPGQASPNYMHRSESRRRGSDSSSEGFRDVLEREKWYIGGRTATGEEKFFKLGVVRRERSIDRLSLDRLSL